MNLFLIYLLVFFSVSSAKDTLKVKSDYFKNLKLKSLDLKVEDLLPKSSLKEYSGESNSISSIMIDSIKIAARDFMPSQVSSNDTIVIETTKGTIKLQYYPDIAFKHCANFKKLANSGFYDMTTFHRVIKNFMIQGGDLLSRDSDKKNDGQGDPGWTIKSEFSDLKHERGVLSMARGKSPDSAGSQFFICHNDSYHLDANGRWDNWENFNDLNGNGRYDSGEPFDDKSMYTIFGKVVENLHVLDLIADTPTSYTVAKLQCYDRIPVGANMDKWVKVNDPKTRASIYSKVPPGMDKTLYMEKLMTSLRSDNPTAPVYIKKIRVLDGKKIDK